MLCIPYTAIIKRGISPRQKKIPRLMEADMAAQRQISQTMALFTY